MALKATGPRVRIGELSRRTGVPASVLRTWESRYGLLSPERSSGGLRLFSPDDEARVRSMQQHMRAGLSAAEAAQAAIARQGGGGRAAGGELDGEEPRRSTHAPAAAELDRARGDLVRALGELDEAGAQAALDELLAVAAFESVVTDVVMPYLVQLGERWRAGTASIAEEHLATQVLRSRMGALARMPRRARGACAVLACPPGESHDLALLMFGVALRRCGWSITLLGANTPAATIREAADVTGCDCVVVAATDPASLAAAVPGLRELSSHHPLYLAGPASSPALAAEAGAERLAGDPVAAAQALDLAVRGRRRGSPIPVGPPAAA